MDTAALDYHLPPEAIAQEPVEPRDQARLLVEHGPGRPPTHHVVADLDRLLHPGDLLVVNDTRVRRARLRLHKVTGGAVEVLLLEPLGDGRWEALVGPSRKAPPGTTLHGAAVTVVTGEALPGGRRLVTVDGDPEAEGEIPLPPYVHRPLADPERYQTVFSRTTASAAAPTAGLHLTTDLLDRCRERGVAVETVELIVGLDTFKPIAVAHLDDHAIHTEAYNVPASTLAACRAARRVVAVGTTVVRSLETAAATGQLAGRSSLFIRPGYRFAVVDLLLTNFHVPRTTLLALVEAFVGPQWRDLYAVALGEGYRFLSFGDAMLLSRRGDE
jgi:S-adenosylmethionine:tRNA ribosyltransferase-isomerase